jgi:hypothetical protein
MSSFFSAMELRRLFIRHVFEIAASETRTAKAGSAPINDAWY